MKHIMFFCIPAHGHHNPTFPVVTELIKKGHAVRYYSFDTFREKVEATGAAYYSCDSFVPKISKKELYGNPSVTEMTILDLKTTAAMDGFLKEQVEEFKPDVIVSDSVCFWGKLTARKYHIPLVISTTTFAFNQASASYMKSSFAEIKDLICGTKRVKAELKALEQYGYHEKSVMNLVKNDNFTDTIVYATKKYQPCSETFSGHYAFVGPSVFSSHPLKKEHKRPLVYISLGTVVNERPDFYKKCIEALAHEDMDVIIACGQSVDPSSLNGLSKNVTVSAHVDQLEVLSRANVFLTHCGMNSVSESLYMGTPMVFFPQTNEQRAVARRAREMGAGVPLKAERVESIRSTILTVLNNAQYEKAAMDCSHDFRSASGPADAADFIEQAPHEMKAQDKKRAKKEITGGVLQLVYWIIAVFMILWSGRHFSAPTTLGIVIGANLLFPLFKKLLGKI